MNKRYLVVLYDSGCNDLGGEIIEAADRQEALNKFVNSMNESTRTMCFVKEASYMKVFELGVA